MLVYDSNIYSEQFPHFLLGKPESLVLEKDFDMGLPLGGGI